MQYGWAKAGVTLPRTTYYQINFGRAVPKGQERPGDLVFPSRGHVAGVSGPGQLIHAPQTGSVVSYRGMYPNPIAIRRPGKFDRGGIWGINSSGRDERVLSPRQTVAFERLVDGMLSSRAWSMTGGGGGARTVNYVVNHVPGFTTEQDLARVAAARERHERAGRPN
jgi:hypothetical protein